MSCQEGSIERVARDCRGNTETSAHRRVRDARCASRDLVSRVLASAVSLLGPVSGVGSVVYVCFILTEWRRTEFFAPVDTHIQIHTHASQFSPSSVHTLTHRPHEPRARPKPSPSRQTPPAIGSCTLSLFLFTSSLAAHLARLSSELPWSLLSPTQRPELTQARIHPLPAPNATDRSLHPTQMKPLAPRPRKTLFSRSLVWMPSIAAPFRNSSSSTSPSPSASQPSRAPKELARVMPLPN